MDDVYYAMMVEILIFWKKNRNLKIPSKPTITGLDWRVRGPL